MKAGEELDRLVLEKVFNETPCKCTEDEIAIRRMGLGTTFARFESNRRCNFCSRFYLPVCWYSTDANLALQVLSKFVTTEIICDAFNERFTVRIHAIQKKGDERGPAEAVHPTFAHAVCVAALEALK